MSWQDENMFIFLYKKKKNYYTLSAKTVFSLDLEILTKKIFDSWKHQIISFIVH